MDDISSMMGGNERPWGDSFDAKACWKTHYYMIPSRTNLSFEAAVHTVLGGQIVDVYIYVYNI